MHDDSRAQLASERVFCSGIARKQAKGLGFERFEETEWNERLVPEIKLYKKG